MKLLQDLAVAGICLLLWAGGTPAAAGEPADERAAFFESRIRPLLVEHCYECHSGKSDEVKGGLRLDSRAGVLKGGDSGPAVEPGKPDESLLIQAVRYEGLEMPPTGKLPAAVVADFATWVAAGAVDPRSDPSAEAGATVNGAGHWAFQPIRRPEVPSVRNEAWPITTVDRFVLAKLEAAGLSPSPTADKRTLLRRVYIDLVGLPPTPAELAAFVADDSPDAYEKVVERLLASPHYGERWGRHWLDVARYADTKDGVLMYGDDRIRPYAYTYRDYVVRSFNEDTAFDRFVHEQLAADQIQPAVEPWRLAAMGYLTLGKMFDNNVHDVLDDQIDVVSRGFLGLTVACARCHDHKYDPIPTADYYSLYGVFASCEAPAEPPLIGAPDGSPGYEEFEKQASAKRQEVQKLVEEQYALLIDTARQRVGDYLIRAATTEPDLSETAIFFLSLQPEDLRPPMVMAWRRYLERRARPDDPVFGLWQALMAIPEGEFSTRAVPAIAEWLNRPDGTLPGQVNPLVRTVFAAAHPASHGDVAKLYGELLARVYTESKAGAAPEAEADARQQLLEVVQGADSPTYFPKSRTWAYMSRGPKDAYGGLMTQLDKLAVQSPHAPPRAMMLTDSARPFDPKILVRGSPARPGEPVPRRFLKVVSGEERQPFANGSGRLDLAKAITDPGNPLTSRVFVNRVWMEHFGRPLVENPSDFGTRTGPPTHPELLDWLAEDFMASAWNVKRLHREMVLSATYRQSSSAEFGARSTESLVSTSTSPSEIPTPQSLDPENKLLWRMNRRRLDLEAMRDSLLALSGRLDPRLGGRAFNVTDDPLNARRTVYGLVDRQSLPAMYRAFDFASPDQSADRRPRTTVPQQALFGMNSPFVLEQAKGIAGRAEVTGEGDPARKVAAINRLVLLREPTAEELSAAVAFVTAANEEGTQLDRWQQYAQVLLLTNELMFVD